MPKRRPSITPQFVEDVLMEALTKVRNDVRSLKQTGPSSLQPDNWEEAVDPAPWETTLHVPQGRHREAKPWDTSVYYHPGYTNSVTGETIEEGFKALSSYSVYAPKIYNDKKTNRVDASSDAPHRFGIHPAHDRARVYELYAYNGTPGSGSTTVRVHNLTRGIVVATTTIPGGAYMSTTFSLDEGGNPALPNNMVFAFDRMWAEVTAVGGGSKGLGIYMSVA